MQAGLGRPEATCAALIPIRKSEAWWSMAQDERRAVFEDRSRHIALSMKYLPAVARRLHHARDLGEPFDFLTWFEFAPEHAAAFDDLLAELRASPNGPMSSAKSRSGCGASTERAAPITCRRSSVPAIPPS